MPLLSPPIGEAWVFLTSSIFYGSKEREVEERQKKKEERSQEERTKNEKSEEEWSKKKEITK